MEKANEPENDGTQTTVDQENINQKEQPEIIQSSTSVHPMTTRSKSGVI